MGNGQRRRELKKHTRSVASKLKKKRARTLAMTEKKHEKTTQNIGKQLVLNKIREEFEKQRAVNVVDETKRIKDQQMEGIQTISPGD